EPLPADELEKARNFTKGRFVLQLESPQGLTMFGLRKEVLEHRLPDSEEVVRGLDAVTSDDVARVATELIATDRMRLAVIGPIDDTRNRISQRVGTKPAMPSPRMRKPSAKLTSAPITARTAVTTLSSGMRDGRGASITAAF